jgi:hypothetical protein
MEDHIDQICKEKEKTKRKCMRSGQNLILHTASVPHIHQLSTPDVKFLGRESAQVAG